MLPGVKYTSIPGMDAPVALHTANYDMFWKFIYTRQMIWYKRFILQQPAPWTDDPILRDYKFTNVYRELDRNSLYSIDNIVGIPGATTKGSPLRVYAPIDEQVLRIIIFRLFNRIWTYNLIAHLDGFPWKRVDAYKILRMAADKGEAIYTDAHITCAYAGFPGETKLERVMYIFDEAQKRMPALMRVISRAKSLEHIHQFLSNFKGLGPFLAYEVCGDIAYAPWNNIGEDEWANPGPGCQRGLRRLFPDLNPKSCVWLIKVLREAQDQEFSRLNLPFASIAYKGKPLTLRAIENCCCEFSKYMKAHEGSGRPRNKFRPIAKIGAADFTRLKG